MCVDRFEAALRLSLGVAKQLHDERQSGHEGTRKLGHGYDTVGTLKKPGDGYDPVGSNTHHALACLGLLQHNSQVLGFYEKLQELIARKHDE